MIKLTLSQKGIALVCLPLCFQIVFLVVLIDSLVHAEAAIKREATSKQVIYTAGYILRHSIECATSVAIYNFTREPRAKEKAIESIGLAKRGNDEIAELVRNNPLQLSRIIRCRDTLLEADAAMKRLFNKMEHPEQPLKVWTTKDTMPTEREMLSRLINETGEFIEAERVLCRKFVEQEQQARHLVVLTLGTGIVLNLLIAIIASIYFFRSIVSRLNRLTKNTLLIPQKKVSIAEIGGTDEIAELDRAFLRAVNQLQNSEEMRRQLVAMVSHDLRSPLSSVDAALTLLNEGVLGPLPLEAQTVSKNASADVARLVKLTNDLLDADSLVSGAITLRLRYVPAQSLMEEARHAMEYASLTSDVAIEIGEANFTVNVDPDRINQVLCNLIGNAIKFSSSGNKVVVEALEGKSQHEFRVTDTGSGITTADQQIIFDRFTRACDESKPGKGLGLAICKALVELHGGSIGVKSELGKGSTFWFTIPASTLPQN